MSNIQKNEAKALSPVDKMMLDLMGSIEKRSARLENLLPPDLPVERFTESVRLALAQTPALLKCDPGSVLLSVMRAAKLGIDVAAGPLGHGALVPFGGECTFVPMYKGLVALAVVSGVVKDMTPVLVYEKDHFVPEEGDNPKVDHKPYVPKRASDSRGDIIAAYTRVLLPDGTRVIKGMLYADDIARIEASSKAGNSPWKGPHRAEMVKKSAIKNAIKTVGIPSTEQTRRLRDALAADVEAEARGLDADETPTHAVTPASHTDALKAQLKSRKKQEAPTDVAPETGEYVPGEPPPGMALGDAQEPGSEG